MANKEEKVEKEELVKAVEKVKKSKKKDEGDVATATETKAQGETTPEAKVKKLIEKVKNNGTITLNELASELENTNPEQIEDVFDEFEKMGVEVLKEDFEDEPNIEDLKEVEELKIEEITETSFEGISIDDPVRMYLREIGKIPLLKYEE